MCNSLAVPPSTSQSEVPEQKEALPQHSAPFPAQWLHPLMFEECLGKSLMTGGSESVPVLVIVSCRILENVLLPFSSATAEF